MKAGGISSSFPPEIMNWFVTKCHKTSLKACSGERRGGFSKPKEHHARRDNSCTTSQCAPQLVVRVGARLLNTWQNHTLAVNQQLLDIFTQSITSRLTFTRFRLFVWSNAKDFQQLSKMFQKCPSFSKSFPPKNPGKFHKKNIHPLQTCMLNPWHLFALPLSYKNKTASESLTCSEIQGLYIARLFLFSGRQLVSKAQMSATKDICTGQTFGIIKIWSCFFSIFCSPRQHFYFITNTVTTVQIVKYY